MWLAGIPRSSSRSVSSMSDIQVSAVILTLNEELNIVDCIRTLREWCEDVVVYDSFSTDKTVELAKAEGIVVPSKFFGALAMGRPVIYMGPSGSCLEEYINHYSLGYSNRNPILNDIDKLLNNSSMLDALKSKSFTTYRDTFSREKQFEAWQRIGDSSLS